MSGRLFFYFTSPPPPPEESVYTMKQVFLFASPTTPLLTSESCMNWGTGSPINLVLTINTISVMYPSFQIVRVHKHSLFLEEMTLKNKAPYFLFEQGSLFFSLEGRVCSWTNRISVVSPADSSPVRTIPASRKFPHMSENPFP